MKFIELLEQRNINFEIKRGMLIVYDKVDLSRTQLKELPECSMVFLKEVNFMHTQLEEIPNFPMTFFDNVYLGYTKIKKLPDTPILFFGHLNLSYTDIKELPSYPMNLKGLDLSHTNIEKLPSCSMSIGEDLNISHTNIKELSDNLICHRLYIHDTPITRIPKNLMANYIFTPFNYVFDIYIEKYGIIGINYKEKTLDEWKEFFRRKESFDDNSDLTPEEYNMIERDFNIAVKLLESWK